MEFGGNKQGMDEMSVQISFRMMNNTMKECFGDCVTDFRQGEMSQGEETCMKNCATRAFSLMQTLSAAEH